MKRCTDRWPKLYTLLNHFTMDPPDTLDSVVTLGWGMGSASEKTVLGESQMKQIRTSLYKDCIKQKPNNNHIWTKWTSLADFLGQKLTRIETSTKNQMQLFNHSYRGGQCGDRHAVSVRSLQNYFTPAWILWWLGNTLVVAGGVYIYIYTSRLCLPRYAIYSHLVTSTITNEVYRNQSCREIREGLLLYL